MYVMFDIIPKVEENLDSIKKRVYDLLDEHLGDYGFSMTHLFVDGQSVDFSSMKIEGDLDD